MVLTLIGLIFNFIGSILLIFDALINYTRGKSSVVIEYPDTPGKRKIYRYSPKYKQVKITREEILLIISISLIGIGFLLQILDFISQEFWINSISNFLSYLGDFNFTACDLLLR